MKKIMGIILRTLAELVFYVVKMPWTILVLLWSIIDTLYNRIRYGISLEQQWMHWWRGSTRILKIEWYWIKTGEVMEEDEEWLETSL